MDRPADAEHVDVIWDVRGSEFELVVTDDGRGFESAKGVRDSAYGLVGMRERADVVGARLTIDSTPGRGTTVTVTAGPTPTPPRDRARTDTPARHTNDSHTNDSHTNDSRTTARSERSIDTNREVAS